MLSYRYLISVTLDNLESTNPYIDLFLGQYVLVVGFFFFRGFGLVNKLVDQLDLAVNEPLENVLDQQVATYKNQHKSRQRHLPFLLHEKNAHADGHGQCRSSKCRKLAGREVFCFKHGERQKSRKSQKSQERRKRALRFV